MNDEPKHKISFGGYELDVAKRQLLRGGEDIHLNPKAFDVLVFLAENSGRIVSKDEILQAVWDTQFVEEANLAVQISTLRKALNEQKNGQRFFVNVPGKGYKFVADVQTDEEIVIEKHKFSRLVIEETTGKSPKSAKFSFYKIAAVSVLLLTGVAIVWFWRSNANNLELKQPKISRLTTSGKVTASTITPDGRYAVFAQREKDGESLWLRQIETGSQTRINQPQNVEYLGLAVSPDGNFVYASVFLDNRADVPLWKIPILGGAAQEIQGIEVTSSISFSPDGKLFAYTESHQPETHLKVADADGTNARILIRANYDQRVFPTWKSNPVAWSPDGSTIAVGFEEKSPNGVQAGILLVNPLDGSEKILVSPRWAYVEEVVWLNAENLVFTAYDDDWSNQIWTVNRQTGEVRRVTNDLQKYRWMATSGGKLLSGQVTAVSHLYVADFSEDVKKLEPREIFRESGYIPNVAWGKDGDIFYSSRSTGEPEIWRIKADGTNPMQVTSGAKIHFGLAVSPTDSSIVFCSYRDGKYSISAADANGKNLRPVTEGIDHITPQISADGTIVFQSNSQFIWRISPTDKIPVKLHRGLKPVISPDGRQTAFFMMDKNKWRIALVATATGELLKKIDFPVPIAQRRMRWHPSGKFLTLFYEVGENTNLLLLPIDGREPRSFENLGKGELNSFSWSSDGKQLIYSITNETQDAVLLDNF